MTVTVAPHLWYVSEAEEAARFYVSVVPGSRIDRLSSIPADSPAGPAGSVRIVEFTLAGSPFKAISARLHKPFTHAVSIMLICDTQEEIDRLWTGLGEGGEAEPCGWLRDRYGLSWQIVPRRLGELIGGSDRARAGRAAAAMMGMSKLDIARLEAA